MLEDEEPVNYQEGVVAAQAARLQLRRDTEDSNPEEKAKKLAELFAFLASMDEEVPLPEHRVSRVSSATRSLIVVFQATGP